MSNRELEETREFWDRVASDWSIQVGSEGDGNRRLNSDPVLWKFAGEVSGLKVLDAGCGTGYLSRKLHDRGALVIGIDFSSRMIDHARAQNPGIDFRVDSCSELATIEDEWMDIVIANYLLMDTPDLRGTMRALYRVLKPGGSAVLVFSHPCFPQGSAIRASEPEVTLYRWSFPYFEPRKVTDPPWAHFTSEFIWFHRPLSDYWKAFKAAGFDVVDFEEPRITEDNYHLAATEKQLEKSKTRPYSVAFNLQKRT